MNKKAISTIMGIMIFLVVVVFTSSIILVLVKSNVIEVNNEPSEDVLNTNFLPISRGGELGIKEFVFCSYVDTDFSCLYPSDTFYLNTDVHFFLILETTPYNGKVMLIENYIIRNPSGEIIFDTGKKYNYHFETSSDNIKELIYLRDNFNIGKEFETGDYSFELIINNPLLGIEESSTYNFKMVEDPFGYEEPEPFSVEDFELQ